MLKLNVQNNFNIGIDTQLDTLCAGFTNDDDGNAVGFDNLQHFLMPKKTIFYKKAENQREQLRA